MSATTLLTGALSDLAKVEVKPNRPASTAALAAGKQKVRDARALLEAPVEPPPPPPPPAETSIPWGARIYHASLGMTNDPPWGSAEWDRFESDCGKKMSILAFGLPFGKFVLDPLTKCRARNTVPLLTTMTENTTIAKIAAGEADALIDQMAGVLAQFDGEVLLRFAHEMNGSWYAYGYTKAPAATYVAAFRRVALKVKAKAPKTKLVWCPNIIGSSSSITDPGPYYPGGDVVDIVGVDGYSYDASLPSSKVFRPTVDRLVAIAGPKPIYICETGCRELPGKPAWLSHLLEVGLPKELPEIKGLTYFNGTEDTWPIQTSAAATGAFRKGIASPYYRAP